MYWVSNDERNICNSDYICVIFLFGESDTAEKVIVWD